MSTVIAIDTAAAFGTVGPQLAVAGAVVVAAKAAGIVRDLVGYRGERPGAQVADGATDEGDAELMALAEGVRERIGIRAPRHLHAIR